MHCRKISSDLRFLKHRKNHLEQYFRHLFRIFVQALLNGGKYQIYSCGNEYKQCLNIKLVEKTKKKNESWVAKINKIMDSVHEKYLKDEGELSKEEEDLITRTDFPVWRIISVLTAYQGNDKPISIWGLSDIIATDLLLMYVKDCVSFLKEGAKKYRMEKMYCDQVDQFIDELKYVEATIQYYELKNSDRFYRKFELMERIDRLEEKMMSEIRF